MKEDNSRRRKPVVHLVLNQPLAPAGGYWGLMRYVYAFQ
jgi:hypothetical protein